MRHPMGRRLRTTIETSLHFLYRHGERLAIVAVIRDITGNKNSSGA